MPDQTLTTPPTTRRLDAFASPLADPAVVHLDGVDIVVLTATGRTDVSVWVAGAVCHLPADTPVVPVTDPARQGTVLRQAVASLNRLREQAEQALGTQRNHHCPLWTRSAHTLSRRTKRVISAAASTGSSVPSV
ncbi:hypothetical protein AB0425_25835 [Actinosynnema sp. NPDC051121]